MGAIYIIKNKINSKVYIGQTVKSYSKRFSQHKCNSRYESKRFNTALYNAMRKYGVENFWVEKIEDNIDIKNLDEKEKYYIKLYNSLSPNGYNLTPGGQDSEYKMRSCLQIDIHTLEIINQYKSAALAAEQHGTGVYSLLSHHHSSKTANGFFFIYKDEFNALSNPKEYILNIVQPICQLNKNGEIVKYYYSCREAEEKTLIPYTNIKSCCQGKLSLAGDFQWCYYKDLSKNLNKTVLDKYRYSVEQIDIETNKVINVFKTAKDAAIFLGKKDGSSISKCCKGKSKTAYGYRWAYRNKEKQGKGTYNAMG